MEAHYIDDLVSLAYNKSSVSVKTANSAVPASIHTHNYTMPQ